MRLVAPVGAEMGAFCSQSRVLNAHQVVWLADQRTPGRHGVTSTLVSVCTDATAPPVLLSPLGVMPARQVLSRTFRGFLSKACLQQT